MSNITNHQGDAVQLHSSTKHYNTA